MLTRVDGTLDTDRMAALADQIAALHRAGVEVIVVSSGAVAAGRGVIAAGHRLDAVSARQLYSAVGQVKLIRRYYELFDARGIVCGQVLTTKQDFETRRHYLNQRNSIRVMLENGVVPIVNENDTVAVTELMFPDNDELSGLLSTMIGAEALVLLTNVDGICDGTPGVPGVEVIREIAPGQRDLPDCIRDAKSSFGRGGMLTKSRIARKVAAEGIETIIADGRRDGWSDKGMTLQELQQVFVEQGCKVAYNLDGGGSATMVLGDQRVNKTSGSRERDVSDIVYFTK